MKKEIRMLLLCFCIVPLLPGLTGCNSPGEKYYEQSKIKKNQADDATGEQRNQLFQESIDLLKKAIEMEPQNARYYAKMAACYKNMEKFPDSAAAYTKAIELDPDDADNYSKLMGIYLRMKKYDEAQEFYDRSKDLDIIKRDPKASQQLEAQRGELEHLRREQAEAAGSAFAEKTAPAAEGAASAADAKSTDN